LINNILSDYLVFDDVAAAIWKKTIGEKIKKTKIVQTKQRHGSNGSQMQRRSKSRSKKTVKCYNCSRKGHFKRDCWFKKVIENSAELSKPQGYVASTLEDGEVLYSQTATVSTNRKYLTEVWLMDSKVT
jgi:hypothetical protein